MTGFGNSSVEVVVSAITVLFSLRRPEEGHRKRLIRVAAAFAPNPSVFLL